MIDNRKKLYIVVFVVSLIVSLLSGTYGYFQASIENTTSISGTIASVGIDLKVERVTQTGNLIPLRESLLNTAAQNNCVDKNGYTACQVYKITVTNMGSTSIKITGHVTLIGNNTSNLKWTRLNSATSYGDASKNGMSKSILVEKDSLGIGTNKSNIYYIMVYLKDTNVVQNVIDSGNFNGIVEFSTDNGTVTDNLNGTGAQTLINKANDSAITTYTDGDPGEMYTFSHLETSQTPALIDYRYIGASPNNYITFNNETWRIIGVFPVDNGTGTYEPRIKIIMDQTLGTYSWDYKQTGVGSSTTNNGSNDWTDSQLMMMLNPTDYLKSGYSIVDNIVYDSKNQAIYENMGAYYNSGSGCSPISIATGATFNCTSVSFSGTGLNALAKTQIGVARYYLGGIVRSVTINYGNGSDMYNAERGTGSFNGSRSLNWTGLVGLMYPSDFVYTYAYGVDNNCFNDNYNCSSSSPASSWLFSNAIHQWTITANNSNASYGYAVVSMAGAGFAHVTTPADARPVVYLNANVVLSGSGTIDNKYTIVS